MNKKTLLIVGLLLGTVVVLGLLYVANTKVSNFSSTTFSTQKVLTTATSTQQTSSTTSPPLSTSVDTTSTDTVPHTAPASTLISNVSIMAWLFPGKTSCTAQAEYSDGRSIQVLKPQYFSVNSDGSLDLLTQAQDGCNGYSAANIASIKAHSSAQFITVSAGIDGLQGLTSNPTQTSAAVTELTNFVVTNNVTGIEIDFEDFGSWDAPTYQAYLQFLQQLGTSLHAQGKQLMVDVPPIGNATEQGYYLLTYKDIAALPVDYIVVMAYDYQFDQGAGTPIAPDAWVASVIQDAKANIPISRLVIGVPSYAYSGTTGGFKITRENYTQMESVPGFSTASRDTSSNERIFQYDGKSYVYVDKLTLDAELSLIESYGIRTVSVWSLGGNQWF